MLSVGRMSMLLSELLAKAQVVPDAAHADAQVLGLHDDSRRVEAGSCFICMPGHNVDGHEFLGMAKERGATSVITHHRDGHQKAKELGLAAVLIENDGLRLNEALWKIARAYFDNPTREMKVIGVTGTNGKTTTAWLLRDMLRAKGLQAAYLGTLGFHLPHEERELANTTPFALELWRLLAEAKEAGVQAIAMEVSSHALAERRVDGVEFDAAVFTNLTQDHLDFHGSMEEYEKAKGRLFLELPKQSQKFFRAALNMDDTAAASLAHELQGKTPLVRYWACDCGYDLGFEWARPQVDHLDGVLCAGEERLEVRVALGGSYNVENVLSATAGMMALGYKLDDLRDVFPKLRPVPGRFEAVPNEKGIGILVDYAHTPDALEKLLDAARPLTNGRLITVFGCGGDRDRTKRPKMARAASERSDVTVVTSDNPRTEDPHAIVNEVRTGVLPGRESVAIVDRREAVAHAVKIAKPGDIVVVAGKGHENYQIIGRTKHPMDDRELARAALEER
jgi:UDP-N-acetylmuramoyl-L-alanyl-D-glutamate--2,6-diaminopimelate ligase